MNGPYMSAVSSRLAPASSAACTARSEPSPLRWEAVYAQLMGMHPRPIAPTSSVAAPILLRSTWPDPSRFSHQTNV
ncbi:hypothetical protein GCM10010246_61930 [Streptomyces cuspidosporus]|uniref:Uncharacterized protein n=1 Tax=Streptomyces cuspidosporus TaxID=66882 RepID=A0ABP5TV12_9ACTN